MGRGLRDLISLHKLQHPVQEMYMSLLTEEFVERRLRDLARESGIGPHKLQRARMRGKAGRAS